MIREADLSFTEQVGSADGWIGSVAIVEIVVPNPIGPVLLVHHKPTWEAPAERERELQAVRTARLVEEILNGDDRHVVLAGDFDATPEAASVRFLTGQQSLEGLSVYYQDAWAAVRSEEPGHTFHTAQRVEPDVWKPRPGRRIDYIMVRCGSHGATLDITSCDLVFTEPDGDVWASDHFGVVADLEALAPTSDPP